MKLSPYRDECRSLVLSDWPQSDMHFAVHIINIYRVILGGVIDYRTMALS